MALSILMLSLVTATTLPAPSAEPEPVVQVRLSSHHRTFKAGKPISLTAQLVNESPTPAYIDGRLIYRAQLHVIVKDDQGLRVQYPGWNIKNRVAAPQREDFIRLGEGIGVFREDFTGGQIELSKPGRYRIWLHAYHGASPIYATKYGIKLCKFGAPASVVVTVIP